MFGFKSQKIFGVTIPGFNRRPHLPQQVGSNGKGPVGAKSPELGTRLEPRELAELIPLMEEDYQIKFSKYIIAANIASVEVTVTVENGDGEKSDAIQGKLQKLWGNAIESMQESEGYGRVAYEKIKEYDPIFGTSHTKKLVALPFSRTRLRLTDDGSFGGIDLKTNDGKWVKICAENSFWLALNATAMEPHGQSQYLGAVFKAWKRKNKNIDNRQMLLEKFLIPGGKGHIPMTEVDETTGVVHSVPEKIAAALSVRKSGGYLMMPNEQHPTMEGKYKYDIEDATQLLDPAPIDAVLTNDDVAILRARGIPEKTVTEGGSTGSFAMVTQQMLTLFARIESTLGQFVNSFQNFVADKDAEDNYGPPTATSPRFILAFTKITNRPDSLVGELLKILVANPQFSTVLASGGIDMRQLLTTLGLPVSDEFEELVQQVAARFAAAAGAMAPAGQIAPDVGQDNALGDAAAAVAVGDVAGYALNGAQIASLLEIIGNITSGAVPIESAKQIISVSFPAIAPEKILAIVGPLAGFIPAVLPNGDINPAATATLDNNTAEGGGEYSGMARRGWANNRKAINDIRSEFADGTASEAYARTMLATLGLPPAAIDALIADALDGKNDEPLDALAAENNGDGSVKKK